MPVGASQSESQVIIVTQLLSSFFEAATGIEARPYKRCPRECNVCRERANGSCKLSNTAERLQALR